MDSGFLAFRYPLFYLDILVLAGVAALFCLLGIWAGISRRHWFWRAGAGVIALLALLPIQAHQPALMLAFILPALSITASWLNRRGIGPRTVASETAPRRMSFGLRDLLLGVLLAGLICYGATVLIARRHELDWQCLLVGAPSLWLLATTCYIVAFTPRRRFVAALLLGAMIPGVTTLEIWMETGCSSELAGVVGAHAWDLDMSAIIMGGLRMETLACMFLTAITFATLQIGLLWLFIGRMSRAVRTTRIVLTLVCGVVGTLLYWQMSRPSGRQVADPSLPNSYVQLLQVARRVASVNVGTAEDRDLASLEGLQFVMKPGFVPFYPEFASDDLKTEEMSSFRNLAQAWKSEANAQALKRDWHEAARYRLSTIRLGAIVSHRGLIIHGLIGLACERMGTEGLTAMRDELSPDTARYVLAGLVQLDQGREPYARMAERDRQWSRTHSAWRSRFAVAIEAWGRAGVTHPEAPNYEWIAQQRDATIRLLITDLAVRLHRDEHGSLPPNLQALVPRYLPAMPVDPFSGESIIYRPQGDDFVVYSVGLDGKDDGGRFGTRTEAISQSGFDWGLEFVDELP